MYIKSLLCICSIPIKRPAGIAQYPEELYLAPRAMLSTKFHNIVTYTDMPQGGHFAAFEDPKMLAEDFFGFVEKIEMMGKKEGKTEL